MECRAECRTQAVGLTSRTSLKRPVINLSPASKVHVDAANLKGSFLTNSATVLNDFNVLSLYEHYSFILNQTFCVKNQVGLSTT